MNGEVHEEAMTDGRLNIDPKHKATTDDGLNVDPNHEGAMETEEMENSVESDLVEDHYGSEDIAGKSQPY